MKRHEEGSLWGMTKEDIDVGTLIIDKFGDNYIVLGSDDDIGTLTTLLTMCKSRSASEESCPIVVRISSSYFVEYAYRCYSKPVAKRKKRSEGSA